MLLLRSRLSTDDASKTKGNRLLPIFIEPCYPYRRVGPVRREGGGGEGEVDRVAAEH